jgi:hypothetical protein
MPTKKGYQIEILKKEKTKTERRQRLNGKKVKP